MPIAPENCAVVPPPSGPTALEKGLTANVTNVPASITAVTLLAANPDRHSAYFFNESTSLLYIKLGVTPSTTSYTFRVPSNTSQLLLYPTYLGEVTGIWIGPDGAARVTEVLV